MLHSSKNATCQEKETESITWICNYNKACAIIRITHAQQGVQPSAMHYQKNKLPTQMSPTLITHSFMRKQSMHTLTLSCVTNQCPKLTQELHVSTYHIAVYVCACVFPPFCYLQLPHCNTILNQQYSQFTRWNYAYDQMPPAFTQWILTASTKLLQLATQPRVQISLPSW